VPLSDVWAGEQAVSVRQQALRQELDCVEQSLNDGQKVGWSDVCYSDERNSYAAQRRQDIISQALDRTAQASDKKAASSAVQSATPPDSVGVIFSEPTRFSPERVARASQNHADHQPKRLLPQRNPLRHLEMGMETGNHRYSEPGIMRNKGSMKGVFVNYTYRTQENRKITKLSEAYSAESKINMYRLEGRYVKGNVDYSSETTGSIDKVKDTVYELRAMAGYDVPLTGSFVLTPYAGFGMRYLNDNSKGRESTTGYFGYKRESRYYYLPLGLEGVQELAGRWKLGFAVEYDYLIVGEQRNHLEDVLPGYSMTKYQQKDGYGVRGAIRVTKQLTYLDMFLEPYVRYWSLGDSVESSIIYDGESISSGVKAENNTYEYGLRFGARY